MINKKHFLKTNKVGFVSGAVLLTILAGNASYAGVTVGIEVPVPVVVVSPPVVVAPPVVVVEDDYVYYPDYAIYYNRGRHQYAYLEGGAWVFAAAPMGVTVDVLLASPSVHMDWHDSPANHHSQMLQKYPGNRKSSAAPQAQKEDRKPDQQQDRKADGPDHDRK